MSHRFEYLLRTAGVVAWAATAVPGCSDEIVTGESPVSPTADSSSGGAHATANGKASGGTGSRAMGGNSSTSGGRAGLGGSLNFPAGGKANANLGGAHTGGGFASGGNTHLPTGGNTSGGNSNANLGGASSGGASSGGSSNTGGSGSSGSTIGSGACPTGLEAGRTCEDYCTSWGFDLGCVGYASVANIFSAYDECLNACRSYTVEQFCCRMASIDPVNEASPLNFPFDDGYRLACEWAVGRGCGGKMLTDGSTSFDPPMPTACGPYMGTPVGYPWLGCP